MWVLSIPQAFRALCAKVGAGLAEHPYLFLHACPIFLEHRVGLVRGPISGLIPKWRTLMVLQKTSHLHKVFMAAATALLAVASQHAFCAEAACEPILKASEASLGTAHWQKTMTLTDNVNFKLEIQKVGDVYYTLQGGSWKKQGRAFSESVRAFVTQARTGQINLSR